MKRIDTKDGLFDDGNHVFGIHGTRVSAEFLNDIQEEIVNVIGAKNLDGSKRDQLITAIRNIVKSGGGSSSGSAITQADQDKIDSSYHKLKHFVEDELGIALDAKNDAQLKTAIDSAIAKLQAQLDVIKTEQLSQNNKINTIAQIDIRVGDNSTSIADIRKKMTNGSTETTAGVAEIATQNEANDGNDDSKIVTPKKLKVITSDLDSRATRIRNDVDRNTADLVTHRTDIQQNTTDIVSNTASIATIINTIKKGITTTANKLAQSFTVPSALHDKIQVNGEDKAGHYGYAVAMHNDYLVISDPVLQEVVIYQRDKTNSKIFNLEDVHKGKKHGDIFGEDGQLYIKRSDGVHLDVFKYDETQTNLTFKKVSTINLTGSFGKSLAVDDEYLIVGNPQASTALIYKHSGIQWQLVKQLNGGDSFGSSVAINHKYILVSEVANKKAEVYKISRTFDFSAERVTSRFKVKADVYLNAPAASTAGFLGYTVADDDGVNFYQLAQNLDDNAVYVRKFDGGNNGVWETSNQSSFEKLTTTNARTVTAHKKYQRFYSVNQINNKLIVGTYNEWSNVSSVRYAGHLAVDVETNKIYYKGFDNNLAPAWNEVSDKMPLDDFHQMMNATNRTVTVENNTANMALGRFYYNNENHNRSGDNTYFKSTRQIYAFSQDDVSFVYTGTTGNWVKIQGTRPADLIQLEVVPPTAIKHFKTITGGASFGKLIDLADVLSAFAEPDNNILKIYENSVELASKTVKADCINVGKGVVLATSKTDKKAYIYDFYSRTGWFTTKRTKWSGLPNNAQGYSGYNIAGGQYQLVRPVGTTDTYTKYKGGSWIKNGTWGGMLWYDGSKLGIEPKPLEMGQKKITTAGFDLTSTGFSADGKTIVVGDLIGEFCEVYEYKNGAWGLKGARLTGGGDFGWSCSLSSDGDIVAIGARNSNYCEVYEYKNGAWGLKGARLTGSGFFGISCSLSSDGDIVAIGARNSNYCEVYEYKNGAWGLKGARLTGSGFFGMSCSLSSDGDIVAIGANNSDYFEVYEYKNGAWGLKGARLTGGTTFGFDVKLTPDGNTIIEGADTGNEVRVYEFKGGTWVQKGQTLTGTGHFGWCVRIDSTGNTFVAGTYTGGYAEIYTYVNTQWELVYRYTSSISDKRVNVGISKDGNIVFFRNISSFVLFSISTKILLNTVDGKHYYNNKEVKDSAKFDSIMETVAPLSSTPNPLSQPNRNIKFTLDDIQEQPNKTGNYVSLLGTGTATTAKNIDDTNFTIGNNYGDACAITTDKVLITNKTDSKLAIYDHKGTKQKEIQLETGVGSVIDATDTEAIVGSEKANKFEVINLKI